MQVVPLRGSLAGTLQRRTLIRHFEIEDGLAMTKRLQSPNNFAWLGTVLQHMRQHDEIELPTLCRRQSDDTIDWFDIGDFVDVALCSKAIGNELPTIATIVEHSFK